VTEAADWKRVTTGDGSITLAHPLHGQTCHSRAGAWTEARERYAAACRVHERALELARSGQESFRLLDIGTGLGLNLAAALEALEGTGVVLAATTLEIDPSVIEATLALGSVSPPELEARHALVRASLARALRGPSDATVPLSSGTLRLLLGDGRATILSLEPQLKFDAVFLDPFSPGVDAPLWEPGFLGAVAARMAPSSMLSTYSVSLRVRAALL
jgi:tRNA U34 5-methylaminomethyl-2-thiouridine-forming methyltransferase MnmC